MSVESFEPTSNMVTVTQSAADHFYQQVTKKGAKAIRLGLKEAGCTGFKYVIEEVDQPAEKDVSIQLQNNVVIYIDGEHLSEFQGMVIDYKQEGINKSLVLDNPNVKSACGCGESFNF